MPARVEITAVAHHRVGVDLDIEGPSPF